MRKFLITAGIVFSFTACSKSKWDQAISEMEGFKDRMCKCADKACGDKVKADQREWMENFAKKLGDKEEPPKDLDEKGDKLEKEMRECYHKLDKGADEAAPAPTPAPAP